jgi:hypothetical protein
VAKRNNNLHLDFRTTRTEFRAKRKKAVSPPRPPARSLDDVLLHVRRVGQVRQPRVHPRREGACCPKKYSVSVSFCCNDVESRPDNNNSAWKLFVVRRSCRPARRAPLSRVSPPCPTGNKHIPCFSCHARVLRPSPDLTIQQQQNAEEPPCQRQRHVLSVLFPSSFTIHPPPNQPTNGSRHATPPPHRRRTSCCWSPTGA